jgi:hypothetical protein
MIGWIMTNFTPNTTLSAAALNTAFNQADLNEQTSTTYTLLLADQGKLITLDNASPVTLTIPTNATAALPLYTVIGLLNKGAGLVTIAPAAGVTLSPAVRLLSQNEGASLVKTGTNTWYFVQGGGFPKALVSSSTAASVTAVTVGGLPAKVYKFTGTGSITLTKAGLVDVIVQAPGGPGGTEVAGGGGAGGFIERSSVYVPAGSNLVYVGAGTAQGTQGVALSSFFSGIVAVGGGNAAWVRDRMPSGGGCGGANGGAAIGTAGLGYYGQGLIVVSAGVTRGGNGAGFGGGGGGVAGDAAGGSGGAGTTPDATTWASPGLLGQGGGGASMTANTGNGGNTGSNGNSGLVLIRVFD